jgi:hypothetical protein
LEPAQLLVFNQPSDPLRRLVELAKEPAPPSASAAPLRVDFRGAVACRRSVVTACGESANLAEILADTPAVPRLQNRGETLEPVARQLALLGGMQVLGRQTRDCEPVVEMEQMAIALRIDTALSTLCAEFLALTADPTREVSIGGRTVTLQEAGWIDSWVPVQGEDRINNAECARRVLAGYRERTWQATWWMLRLAKTLGVVFG